MCVRLRSGKISLTGATRDANADVITVTTDLPTEEDNAIHWINHYPSDSATGFAMTYPLGSDLSSG